MAEEKVVLRKVRDFGENLNDTFLFIRQNLKPLLMSFFAICGVFMLGKAIFSGIYQSHSFALLDQFRKPPSMWSNGNMFESLFTPEYFLLIIFSWLSFIAMRVVLAAYIKYYAENDGAIPSIEQVWPIFRKYFFRVFIYSIPVGLLIGVGTICCLAPGVYLAVVFVPFDMILVVEDLSFGEAFARCFTIIKENFWISFAIYLVAGIVYYFSSLIVSLVAGLFIGLATYFTTKSIGTTAGVVTSFLNIFAGAFYIIFFVSSALQYFNLVELHDGTGILQRIDTIGGEQTKIDNTLEEY